MREILTVYILLNLIVCKGISQNLVPNPSFEILSKCPETNGQLSLAVPWKLAGPSFLGVDLYNTCSINPRLKPPSFNEPNCYFFQYPRTGEGMTFFNAVDNIGDRPVSEYIGTTLKSRLKKNVKYYIRFFVSPEPNMTSANDLPTYFDAIGLAFAEKEYYEDIKNNEAISIKPVIENRGKVISDTTGWTKVSGAYNAMGNESFAIIGNFRRFNELLIYRPHGNIVWPEGIHYFLDDVYIGAFDPFPDTLMLCKGESIKLNASFLESTYEWSTGETDSIIYLTKPGKYYVNAFIDGYEFVDSVIIIPEPEWTIFNKDTILCQGDNLNLTAPIPGTYTWSDGSNNKEKIVSEEGLYILKIENECGEFRFEVNVDTILCNCKVKIANIFTPDGNGLNDIIKINIESDFEYNFVDFKIFDRWGENVYTCQDFSTEPGWDGTFKGQKAQNGVYIWVMRLDIVINNQVKRKVYSGDITLLR